MLDHKRPRASAAESMPTESPVGQKRNAQRALLGTTRVGFVYFALVACLVLFGFCLHMLPQAERYQTVMWGTALAICCVGGLTAMSSVRTLRVIESELCRDKKGQRGWQSARPIASSDPLAVGWNQLLEDAAESHDTDRNARGPADLDQEVITLARAMRGLPVAWVITDGEGVIRFLGPAACGLLNLSEEENHVGRDLPELIGLREESDDTAQAALDRMLGPIRMLHERRTVNISSRQLHLRITRSHLSGRSGDGEGLAWVLADITQQRIATEARDQFLMTATHELRTPLNNLQAYAEAIQEEDGLELERQKEFCNIINSEANRLGRLVDQLLTVSQMEAGSMVANRHELELLPMLEYATEQVRGQAEQKQTTLTSNLSAKLPTVFGDRDKLQAALVNLVGNAIKYTPEHGNVVLRCSADERWIRIDVEDDGPGIPDEEHMKVFEKFYRGASTQETDHRGNGLGLAFAREIARLHGGDIELQSTVGDGSVFTLRLPVGGRSRSGV
ncbi:MAG: ATP-binding protein [Rubripirellula sp.]